MKPLRIYLLIISFVVLSPLTLKAQNLHCEKFISKPLTSVIEKYGKPVFTDDSNPEMTCVFYKDNNSRKVFVSGKKGIYQAEAWEYFSSKAKAESALDNFISDCCKKGFVSDTVSNVLYNLSHTGVKLSIEMSFNKNTKKYELKTEAHESED